MSKNHYQRSDLPAWRSTNEMAYQRFARSKFSIFNSKFSILHYIIRCMGLMKNFFKKIAEKFGGLKKSPYLCTAFRENAGSRRDP